MTVASNIILMRRPSAADRADAQAMLAECAPMAEVLTCDNCGESCYDICAIPAPFGTDHICADCYPRHRNAGNSDFTDWPIVQVGSKLAEAQLARVQRDIDRFPTIPANNSYGPHTAEDWGVSPVIPLLIVGAASITAAGVLMVLSWLTGWPL